MHKRARKRVPATGSSFIGCSDGTVSYVSELRTAAADDVPILLQILVCIPFFLWSDDCRFCFILITQQAKGKKYAYVFQCVSIPENLHLDQPAKISSARVGIHPSRTGIELVQAAATQDATRALSPKCRSNRVPSKRVCHPAR